MWQPNRAQWSIIWTAAVLLVLGWPPDKGRSLGVKAVNWAVDPAGSLPTLARRRCRWRSTTTATPSPAHDAEEAEYYRLRDSSTADALADGC